MKFNLSALQGFLSITMNCDSQPLNYTVLLFKDKAGEMGNPQG